MDSSFGDRGSALIDNNEMVVVDAIDDRVIDAIDGRVVNDNLPFTRNRFSLLLCSEIGQMDRRDCFRRLSIDED